MGSSNKTSTLLVVVVGCFLLLAGSVQATGTAKSTEALRQQILERLADLEDRHPGEQATIFQIRFALESLYQQASPDLTDPVCSKGFTVPDLSRGKRFYDDCEGLSGQALRKHLAKLVGNHCSVGYQEAQDIVFEDLDNYGGWVECIYTGRKLACTSEPNASDMNIEHTWPQSQGATGIAKSDLHHLFPSDSKANNIRANLPFGKVADPTWEQGGSKCDRKRFEVRAKQRGDTARAKFYFALRYNMSIPADEEAVLRKWHREDPPDEKERKRNDRIQNIQHNRNPFVDRPEFVDLISDF